MNLLGLKQFTTKLFTEASFFKQPYDIVYIAQSSRALLFFSCIYFTKRKQLFKITIKQNTITEYWWLGAVISSVFTLKIKPVLSGVIVVLPLQLVTPPLCCWVGGCGFLCLH